MVSRKQEFNSPLWLTMLKLSTRNLMILLILIVAILVLFYQKDQKWFQNWQGKGWGVATNGTEEGAGEEIGKPIELTRDYVMDYISGNIAKLSPIESTAGKKWRVMRFWFATDRDLYAEYEDSKIFRQILVSIEGQYEPLNYKIVGYFEPAENGWKLKVGNDTMFGRKLDLYEWNENQRKWGKKN